MSGVVQPAPAAVPCHDLKREMPDDMIMSADGRSLRRGRRSAVRHLTGRACAIWRLGEEESPTAAVATDISTGGVGLQTRAHFAVGDQVMVDIKRGRKVDSDTFIRLRGEVVRTHALSGSRHTLGIEIKELGRKYL